ncbi:hypothetical protein BDA96_03G165700 [Sorghum bicolor]|uniref:Uncharacterized protein n=1 Tax=Sorghum bicolor TaxID=4558 RepID=A0A921REC1_SORBI|nr:hypothetical protein BDA96_03G165700 [Sorghum bicolor]
MRLCHSPSPYSISLRAPFQVEVDAYTGGGSWEGGGKRAAQEQGGALRTISVPSHGYPRPPLWRPYGMCIPSMSTRQS